ncbi:hypothetical protein GCM10009422_07640 [Brevundimonas kwangchunensis]|uniref:Mucin n=1 Tax=Brevundimonas kwangchunensis TaxID=322163 RepID=A0ABN1GP36_9CAUL
MIKALSLAAALALLPLSQAAADPQTDSEAAIEAAAERFEARMEAFGERAEAIGDDASLSDDQKEARIAALWTEYAPDVEAFTAQVTEHASAIAGEALANIDLDGLITEALSNVDLSGALAVGQGMAMNGAWASQDPEHMQTYALMAQYALGEAMDEVDAAMDEVEAVDAVAVEIATPTPAVAVSVKTGA